MADELIRRKIEEGSTLSGEEVDEAAEFQVGPFIAHGGGGGVNMGQVQEMMTQQEQLMKQLLESQNEILRKMQKQIRHLEYQLEKAKTEK
jgi:hypothetical protein